MPSVSQDETRLKRTYRFASEMQIAHESCMCRLRDVIAASLAAVIAVHQRHGQRSASCNSQSCYHPADRSKPVDSRIRGRIERHADGENRTGFTSRGVVDILTVTREHTATRTIRECNLYYAVPASLASAAARPARRRQTDPIAAVTGRGPLNMQMQ